MLVNAGKRTEQSKVFLENAFLQMGPDTPYSQTKFRSEALSTIDLLIFSLCNRPSGRY